MSLYESFTAPGNAMKADPEQVTTRSFGDDLLAERKGSAAMALLYDGQGTTRTVWNGEAVVRKWHLSGSFRAMLHRSCQPVQHRV
ncbi:MAG: hypothetical protein AAFZ67_14215 [Planctomycetota bacterium]